MRERGSSPPRIERRSIHAVALDGSARTLAVRELTHDHASEQPFTRSLSGVRLEEGLERVRVQGRDQESGWGGRTVELVLPRD